MIPKKVETINLNLNVRGMKPSATVAINDTSNRLCAEGKRVVKFGLGQSPFPVPPDVVDALRLNAAQKDYLPVIGLPELRQAVADYHRRVDDVQVEADGVLVGPGSKQLMFLLQLAYYGDVVVPAPCWVSYAPQARIIGRHVRFVQTTYEQGWRLLPDRLAGLCREDPSRPRILILNYPGNPDGNTYTNDELCELAAVAKRFGVVVLADEIYGPLRHEGHHQSIARYYPEGTIISNGISKWAGAGGWRLGTFAFPPALHWLMDAMASLASETFTSTSAPIQHAAVAAYRGGLQIENYLVHVRRVLRALGRLATARLRDAGARLVDPLGAFYLFPDFEPIRDRLSRREIENSDQLCQHCLEETGVAFLPGEVFGMPPSTLTARIAYVDFDGARALLAAESVPLDRELDELFLRKYCRPTMDGIDLLCEWLTRKP